MTAHLIDNTAITIQNHKDVYMQILEELKQQNEDQLVIDLCQIEYIDSAGVSLFVSLYNSKASQQKKIQIINANDKVFNLLQLTKINTLLDIQRKP